MTTIKSIRERLGVTQAALAEGMGCTQGNVSLYERGQTIPPDRAEALIGYALTLGQIITFNDIYAASTEAEAVAGDRAVQTWRDNHYQAMATIAAKAMGNPEIAQKLTWDDQQ